MRRTHEQIQVAHPLEALTVITSSLVSAYNFKNGCCPHSMHSLPPFQEEHRAQALVCNWWTMDDDTMEAPESDRVALDSCEVEDGGDTVASVVLFVRANALRWIPPARPAIRCAFLGDLSRRSFSATIGYMVFDVYLLIVTSKQ